MAIKKANLCKWVAALESGKFRRTTHQLKHNGSYCVLGVACKVYEDETGNKVDWDSDGALPSDVSKWYGLQTRNPKLTVTMPKSQGGDEMTDRATDLNDDYGVNFKMFAAGIVKQFKLAYK